MVRFARPLPALTAVGMSFLLVLLRDELLSVLGRQLPARRRVALGGRPAATARGSRTCPRPASCTRMSGRRTARSRCPTASRSPTWRRPTTDTKVEGGSNATGDRHAVIVNKSTCRARW